MAQFDPNNLDQNVVNLAKAMRQVESGNRAVLPAEGSKLGGASRYQYTTNTWKGVAQKYLGNANAPMTAKNEDQATYLRVKEWKDSGKSPKQIASMWNAGEGEPDAYTGKFKDGRPSVGTNSYGVKYNVPNHTKKVYNEFVKLSKANPPNKTKIQMAGQEEQDPGLLKSLGGALISSEKGFGESLGFGAAAGEGKAANIIRGITALPTKAASTIMNKFSGFGAGSDKYASAEQTREAINQAQESQNKLDDIDLRLGQAIIREKKLGKDTSKLESIWKQHTGSNFDLSKITGGVIDKTAGQVYGEGLGVGLDIATAGTYGKAASAPKMTGTLLTKSNTAANLAGKIGVRSAMPVANKVVTPTIVAQSANLLKTLPSVGKPLPKFGTVVKEGAKAVGTGAGIGYGYDVSMGLQEGETKEAFRPGLGTAIGAAIPGLGAGYKVAKFGGRKAAPKFINSLIGANATFNKAVGRGINPGETVAKYGITANDLEDLVNKTSQARKEVGEILGNTYKLPENAAKTADYSDVIKVIDNELGSIKFEESNASYVEKLQRAKRDILKNYPNLNSLTPEQAHQLKQDLASLRGFDFSQSKNNEFNNVVNGMYGRVTEKVNTLVPELASLNDDFSGLIAAEQSAATREQRNLGKNIISISGKFGMMGGAVGTGVGLATGGIGFLPLIAGAVGAGLEKILASTAVKTRFAKFLSGATNAEKQALLRGKTLVDQRAILAAAKDLGFEFEKEVTQNASKGPFLPPPKEAPPIIGNVNKAVTEQQINLPAPGVLAGRAKIQDKPFRPESNSAFNKRVKEERAYREQKVRENEGSKRFEEMNREEVARKRFEDLSKKDAEKYTPLKGYFGTQKQWEKLVDSVGEEKARKSVLPEMKVYHGTSKSNANNISKEGFKLGKGKYVSKEYPELFKGQEGFVSFTADSAAGQKLYAQSKGRLVEAKIAKNAKVVEYQSLPKQLRERIELLSEVGSLSNKKEREMIFGKDKRIFINGKDSGFTSGASSNFRVETFAEISGLLEKYAKENGVDAIKFGDIQFPQHQIDKNEIRVFNPDVIQTEKTGNSPSRPPSKDIKEAEKSVDKFQKVYHVTPKKSMAERIKNSGLKSSENGNGEAGAYVWKNLDDAKEYNDSLYDGKGQIVELSVPDVDYKKLIKDDSQGISDFANDSAHYFRGDLRSRKQLVEEIINTGKISPGKPVKNPARMRQETAGKNDAKAILKLQSDLDAMESMAKARPVVPAEKDTFFGSPWLERFTKAEYEKRSKLIDKINNLEARQEYKKLSKPSRPPKKPPQQAYGAVAGVEPEYDEQGNMKGVKFDPAKAAMGVGLMAGGDKLSKTEAFKGLSGLSTKIIEKLKGRTSVSKQFISDLTNSGDVKQVERDLIRQVLETEKDDVIDVVKFADKVKVELLPLEVFSSGDTRLTGGGYSGKDMRTLSARYENITLPSEIRGDVKNYKEKIYESPIETSAGNQHYPQMTKNYYGHTRTEDMAPVWKVGDTTYTSKKSAEIYGQPVEQPNVRRVIEVQSDLYQKGKLDREYQTFASEKTLPEYVNFKGEKYKLLSGHDAIGVVGEIPSNVKIQSPNGTKKWVSFDKLKEQNSELFNAGQDKIKELDKLKQYNDPTAHFRMIREEVKQASADGVGKLQFPTGETAMKIEGLGASPMSLSYVDEFGQAIGEVTKNNLKVGKIYRGLNVSGDWVITDVLGEGKFRAISKDTIASYPKAERERIMKGEKPQHPNWLDFSNRQSETFDISGKVDTDNPIYKFYEKEVGKYLKNKYNATLITDDKGVTWWQMDVKPEYGKLPVEAFGIAALAGGTGMAFRPPKRDEK